MPQFTTRHRLPRLRPALVAVALACATAARAEPPPPPSGPEILQELKSFASMGSVLMIAAHPDDEDTQLITYLARGRNYRMAYLSINRGDGGQNVLGGEFGPELGYIRTNELLAARNLDHGVQFFTRAIDFGYSKSPEETLRIWDHQKVLEDVVRVIRTFRPDVIITRFSPETQPGQHGHHTASAILGIEAFKAAGDPKVLPDVPVWQPLRIMQDGGGPGGRGGAGGNAVRMNIGGTDPVLNKTYGAIAQQSRAMHKSQGFGNTAAGGAGRGGGGNAQASFTLLDGKPATDDLMDGVDTTWSRVTGGNAIARLIGGAAERFDPQKPEGSIPALLEIKKSIAAFAADPVVAEKKSELDRLIADCMGLTMETTIPNADVIPGESINLHHSAAIKSDVPVTWMSVRYPTIKREVRPAGDAVVLLTVPQTATHDSTETIPIDTAVSQPYWLRKEPEPGIFHVDDPGLIGRPMNPPAFPVEFVFRVGGGENPDAGQEIVLTDQPVQILSKASPAQQRRPLEIVAPVSLAFPTAVRIFSPRKPATVEVEVTTHTPNAVGIVRLMSQSDWKETPAEQTFNLAAVGDHKTFSFTVTPPAGAGEATLTAAAVIGAQPFATYTTGWKEISYEHLPRLLLQPPATIKAVALDLKIKGKTVGYVPGAGDSVAECIAQMGYTVKQLKPADLTADSLKGLDAVVLGVRAFNVRDDLSPNSPGLQALFDYANAGGTVVEQYNRPDGPGGADTRPTRLAPFNIHVTALRVTDETAKVTFLAPDNPVLNTPNKITDADFANWGQERNIYLPDTVDSHFTPILAMSDPGESPPQTSLLIANTGTGRWVYTSLVFFRELPAGNPGAYRLFANLLSLGK